MNDRKDIEKVQLALNTTFSGLKDDPRLAQRVLAEAKGEGKVKKKLSAGFVLVIALILVTVTALAALLLSAQRIVQEEVLPLAIKNDETSHQEDFSNEELAYIVALARDNDITISESMLNALQAGQGYSEQSAIMELASSEFGSYYEWTIEQQYWFGEVMVAIGWQEANSCRLPKGNEVSCEQALNLAAGHIDRAYGDPVLDTTRWRSMINYRASDASGGDPRWYFGFLPIRPQDKTFSILLEADGSLVSCEVDQADTAQGSDVIWQYEAAHGPYSNWSPETWAAFGQAIKNTVPDEKLAWIFQNTDFILPPKDGITQEKAEKIALDAINADDTFIGSTVCCMDGDIPIWKVETKTRDPKDVGSGRYTAIWNFEIHALSGEIREKREFVIGENDNFWSRWIPWSVCENLPEFPKVDGR